MSERRKYLLLIERDRGRARRRAPDRDPRLAGLPEAGARPRPPGRPRGRPQGGAAEGPHARRRRTSTARSRSCSSRINKLGVSEPEIRKQGNGPDRHPARRRPRPERGGEADRQDRAARALRLRDRPHRAVDRRPGNPVATPEPLRALEAGAAAGEEGRRRRRTTSSRQDGHEEADEEGRQADTTRRTRSTPRRDEGGAAEAVRGKVPKGRRGAEGAGAHARRRAAPPRRGLPRRDAGASTTGTYYYLFKYYPQALRKISRSPR